MDLPPRTTSYHAIKWGREVDIAFPDDDLMRAVVKEVIEGEYPFLADIRDDEGVVIDIGANVGAFSVLAARYFNKATIHAFEPDSRAMASLLKNIKPLDGKVLPYLAAVLDRRAEMPLYRSICSVTSSLFHSELNTTIPKAETAMVPVFAISDIMEKINPKNIIMIKIDTEGGEPRILANMRPWLDHTTVVAVEYHSDTDRRLIDGVLKDFGLYYSTIHHYHRGTLCYARHSFFSSRSDLNKTAITDPHLS